MEIMMYRTVMHIQAEYLAEKDPQRKESLYQKIISFNEGDHVVGESNDDSYSKLKEENEEV